MVSGDTLTNVDFPIHDVVGIWVDIVYRECRVPV